MNGVRFYQASSSKMFGQTIEKPQRETTQSTRGRMWCRMNLFPVGRRRRPGGRRQQGQGEARLAAGGGFQQLIEMMVDADLKNEKRSHGSAREVTATSTRALS